MKVKIGDQIYSSNDQPIMVIFEGLEKQLVSEMVEDNSRFCVYELPFDSHSIEKWMTEDLQNEIPQNRIQLRKVTS